MKKETLLGSVGGISGVSSIISSAQTCNNVCVSSFSALSMAGTATAGLPIFFSYLALPAWWFGFALFAILAGLFIAGKGVKPGFLPLNGGILLAGVPFAAAHDSIKFFWLIGGLLVIAGLGMLLYGRFRRSNV
jgi:hypothetical protein